MNVVHVKVLEHIFNHLHTHHTMLPENAIGFILGKKDHLIHTASCQWHEFMRVRMSCSVRFCGPGEVKSYLSLTLCRGFSYQFASCPLLGIHEPFHQERVQGTRVDQARLMDPSSSCRVLVSLDTLAGTVQ